MLLLVGLGNPGRAYAKNRHNIGFMALEAIAKRHGFPQARARFQGLVSEGAIGGEKVMLLQPQTYMNESGRSVGEAARFHKIGVDEIVVLHDELDLAPAKCRIKTGGGVAGHNGLRSITAHIGNDYKRLRLGIGLGWNDVEYESLNEDFHNRGRRIEEQVLLLRRLWTEEIVDFEGKWHRIDRAGINPLPVQRPIPLFMGGLSDVVLERAARIADGWFPIVRDAESVAALPDRIKRLRERVASFGRDPKSFEIRVQAGFTTTSPEQWAQEVDLYRDMGVDFLCFSTMGTGLEKPRDHIAAMRRYKEALG